MNSLKSGSRSIIKKKIQYLRRVVIQRSPAGTRVSHIRRKPLLGHVKTDWSSIRVTFHELATAYSIQHYEYMCSSSLPNRTNNARRRGDLLYP